jgi:hypothetical protein
VEQVGANNRPQGCMNNKVYANLIAQLNERTSRNYTHVQMKNWWDALKSDYTTWKTLLLHASGLGRDPRTGTIAADKDWWEEKIDVCNLLLHFVFFDMFCCMVKWIKSVVYFSGYARMQKV